MAFVTGSRPGKLTLWDPTRPQIEAFTGPQTGFGPSYTPFSFGPGVGYTPAVSRARYDPSAEFEKLSQSYAGGGVGFTFTYPRIPFSLAAPVSPRGPSPTISTKRAGAVTSGGVLSQSESAAIDAAIKAGTALPVRPLQGRELFERQAAVVISGEAPRVTVPGIRPTIAVRAGPATGTDQSDIGTSQPGEPPMNLSQILGGVQSGVESLARTWSTIQQARAAPPAVNPAPSYAQRAGLVQTPGGGYVTAPSLPVQQAGFGAILPLAGRALGLGGGGTGMVSAVGKTAAIAAATGLGIDMVAGILSAGRPKRRRRRMLTKSDVADISTMAALLGKNSESFKTWLAGSLRR